ncbi:MAG: hypothetical protein MJ054_00525 [Clostridia bacterium]|nr:hypothetical protein [Clostridia bacterium]
MTTNDYQISTKRVYADDRLDVLYMREMRCPYCQTRIPKGTSKCKNCGLTKEQIYYAKLTVPYSTKNNVLMSKVRPADLPFWKMILGAVFGFLGIHCFISKRYLRGLFMFLLTAGFIATLIIFPISLGDETANGVRYLFESKTYLFPGDLLGIMALGLWIWDFFAVLFNQYKYPVKINLGEEHDRI